MAKAPIKKPVPSAQPVHVAQAVPAVQPVAPVSEPVQEPAAQVETGETVEMRKVQTRYRFPVYIPTQARHLMPEDTALVPVDWWVKNQLSLSDGALILAKD